MARILWSGVGPWHKTGYGVQTQLFAPRIRDLGHEVVLHYMGIRGMHDDPDNAHPDAAAPIKAGEWEGIPLLRPGLTEFAPPPPREIRAAFGGHDPDLVIVMKDAWVLPVQAYKRWNTAVWTNIDCRPMGTPDLEFFEKSGAKPIAVSKFGARMMRDEDLDPVYIPHGIDTSVWTPGGKAEARELLGLPADAFIAGINASNIGPRKAWGEQLWAFAMFHHKLERDSLLLIHASPEHPEGINLRHLAQELDIEDAVKFAGNVNQRGQQMANWYRSLDVLLNATYGEGFGLPIVEALACGIRVIGTECSAISEKIVTSVSGWLVGAQPWWNPQHRAWWHIPDVKGIAGGLGMAGKQRDRAALGGVPEYDADRIATECWKPALDGGRLC